MGKKKEFSFLVSANALSVSFHRLKKEIESICDPLMLMSGTARNSLNQSGCTEKAVKLLFRGDYTKYDSPPPEQLNKYAKLSYDTSYIPGVYLEEYNRNIEQYVSELPEKIQEIKKLQKDLKKLIKDADKRSPAFFKSGDMKKSISAIINLEEVNQLISFSEKTRDNIALNPQYFKETKSKTTSIMFSMN